MANQLKTRLYQAKKLNIFKLLSYSTDVMISDLVGKVFKDLPRLDMLVLMKGQLKEFFESAAEDSNNIWAIEEVARWINNQMPAWDREHLYTAQSCNQLIKYVTADIDRPESVDLLHSWLMEASGGEDRDCSELLKLTR